MVRSLSKPPNRWRGSGVRCSRRVRNASSSAESSAEEASSALQFSIQGSSRRPSARASSKASRGRTDSSSIRRLRPPSVSLCPSLFTVKSRRSSSRRSRTPIFAACRGAPGESKKWLLWGVTRGSVSRSRTQCQASSSGNASFNSISRQEVIWSLFSIVLAWGVTGRCLHGAVMLDYASARPRRAELRIAGPPRGHQISNVSKRSPSEKDRWSGH